MHELARVAIAARHDEAIDIAIFERRVRHQRLHRTRGDVLWPECLEPRDQGLQSGNGHRDMVT